MSPRTLLVTTVKNEGPGILEWVAHHRLCGFDAIQVYQNDSTDTTELSLRVLQRLGVIEYYPNRHNKGAHQLRAYRRAARTEAHQEADWCMVLDGDEYLNVHVGDGRVQDLIEACPDEADAILVNWRVFGSSHHRETDSGLITERFTLAEPAGDIAGGELLSPYKPLYRTASFRRPAIHLPRDCKVETPVFVNGSGLGEDAFFRRSWRGTDPGRRKLAQVNHYITRDLQSFLLKHARGSANAPHRDVGLKYWRRHNRNEEEDTRLASRADRIRAEMARLDDLSGGKLMQLRARALRQGRLTLNEALSRPEIAGLKAAILEDETVKG